MIPEMELQGKIAIVTGSTKGIGQGIAAGLARAGASLVIISRNQADCDRTAAEISGLGVQAVGIAADLNKLTDIQRIVEQTVSYFGKIDIVVNNAGTAVTKKAEQITEDDWDKVVDLNLKSVFFVCQAAGRQMIKQKSGKIINVASILGIVAEKMVLPYCAAKGGVIQITKALALEWSAYNIQINALCPGYVLTDINAEALSNEKIYNRIVGKTPLGRLGTVGDMVGAAVFLASPASDYMTGQTLTIDGGWTAQ